MPTTSNALYLKLKSDTVTTVSRARLAAMTAHLGQNETFTVHLALARLFEDIQRGRLASARKLAVGGPMPRFEDTPEGSAPPTHAQNAMLRAKARKALATSAAPARKPHKSGKSIIDKFGLDAA